MVCLLRTVVPPPMTADMGTSDDPWVRIGVVGRPHGVKGALKIHLDNPDSQTLHSGLSVHCIKAGKTHTLTITKIGSGIITFEGFSDRTMAEGMVNAELQVRRSDFVDDDDDSAFLIDLLGTPIVDMAGVALGTLVSFIDSGPQLLAEVKTPSGRVVLVPFVPPIVNNLGPPVVLAPPGGLFNEEDALVAGSAHDVDQVQADDDSGADDDDRAGDEGVSVKQR
jgi:16S rRNA processing protein RimM